MVGSVFSAVSTTFRDRLGEATFYKILHQLIAQAIVLKVIQGGDTAIDATHVWAYASKFGHKICRCKGKCDCPRSYSDTDAKWGAKSKDYFSLATKSISLRWSPKTGQVVKIEFCS